MCIYKGKHHIWVTYTYNSQLSQYFYQPPQPKAAFKNIGKIQMLQVTASCRLKNKAQVFYLQCKLNSIYLFPQNAHKINIPKKKVGLLWILVLFLRKNTPKTTGFLCRNLQTLITSFSQNCISIAKLETQSRGLQGSWKNAPLLQRSAFPAAPTLCAGGLTWTWRKTCIETGCRVRCPLIKMPSAGEIAPIRLNRAAP